MTVGGYISFLVIVLNFHVWLAAESEAFAARFGVVRSCQ